MEYKEQIEQAKRAAAKWREKHQIVGVGELRVDYMVDDLTQSITDLLARAEAAEARVRELETSFRTEKCENGPECAELGRARKRAEAAEARCETLEKMVKEYQDTIVPGYRERAEKAEREAKEARRGVSLCRNGWKKAESERDAAISDLTYIARTYPVDLCDDLVCQYCKHYQNVNTGCPGWTENDCFEWRGKKEE